MRWLERAPWTCTAAFETPRNPRRSSVLHRGEGKGYYERIIKPAEKSKALAGCNLAAQTTQQLAGISRKGWGALGEALAGSCQALLSPHARAQTLLGAELISSTSHV